MPNTNRYLRWTTKLLSFMALALVAAIIIGLVNLKLDLRCCTALANASISTNDATAQCSFAWKHVREVFQENWSLALRGIPTFVIDDVMAHRRGQGLREHPPYRLLLVIWIFLPIMLHLEMMRFLDGAIMCLTAHLLAQTFLFFYPTYFQDPRELVESSNDGIATKLLELDADDGCTDSGRLEATLNRPWTWTVRSVLSWKKRDAGTETKNQEQGSAEQPA